MRRSQAEWEAEWLARVNEALASGLALEKVTSAGLTYQDVADFEGISKGAAWRQLNGRVRRPRRGRAPAPRAPAGDPRCLSPSR